MSDRCEVLPGDSVVARRGGGLLWVDAPGSPALVAALHACLGVSGPGADRVLSAVAGQVSSLAHGAASFALVLSDSSGGAGTGVALWSGKGQPAVDGVPVSGSSVEGCTLARPQRDTGPGAAVGVGDDEREGRAARTEAADLGGHRGQHPVGTRARHTEAGVQGRHEGGRTGGVDPEQTAAATGDDCVSGEDFTAVGHGDQTR